MNDDNLYSCRICWFKNEDKPWWDDGKSPTFCFCPCCWVEFWYQDGCSKAIKMYRKRWIEEWMPWFKEEKKPENWSLKEQIKEVPEEYK